MGETGAWAATHAPNLQTSRTNSDWISNSEIQRSQTVPSALSWCSHTMKGVSPAGVLRAHAFLPRHEPMAGPGIAHPMELLGSVCEADRREVTLRAGPAGIVGVLPAALAVRTPFEERPLLPIDYDRWATDTAFGVEGFPFVRGVFPEGPREHRAEHSLRGGPQAGAVVR